jgi:SAM-dependent methyltransferase
MTSYSSALGWNQYYQHRPPLTPLSPAEASLHLVTVTGLGLDAPILDVGCGTSAFLAGLLALGYANLLATDISAAALAQHQQQLGREQADHILWLEDDVTNPRHLAALSPVLLWHDQGLLQELTTLPEQAAYRHLLNHMVPPGGWVILGVRAPMVENATAISRNMAYDAEQLAALLGDGYGIHQHFERPYVRLAEPARPYTYALFQRTLLA